MSGEARLPGYLRFVWMFFMQPVSLHHRLKACGIEEPDASGRVLWRELAGVPELRRDHLGRIAATLALAAPTAAAVTWLLSFVGMAADWRYAVFGVTFGVAIGVAGGAGQNVFIGVA